MHTEGFPTGRTQVFDSNIGVNFTVITGRRKPLSELLDKKELNKNLENFLHYK